MYPFYKPSSKQPIKEAKGGRYEQNLTEPTPLPQQRGSRRCQATSVQIRVTLKLSG